VGQLTSLRELRVSGNRLAALPREVGALLRLHRLAADNNLLTSIPRAPARPLSFGVGLRVSFTSIPRAPGRPLSWSGAAGQPTAYMRRRS